MQDIKSVYRPPVEENTPVLHITTGCSHNRCRFCGMYKNQLFSIVHPDKVEERLGVLAKESANIERLYLSSGDVFALDYKKLVKVVERAKYYLPKLKTISMFSSIDNVKRKSDMELIALRKMGINEITIGFESGWDDVLLRMNKGHCSKDVIDQCNRLDVAGIDYFFSVIIGIAGHMLGFENASITAEILNRTSPKRIDVAGLTVFTNSDLSQMVKEKRFIESSEYDMVREMIILIEKLKIDTYFDGTHCTVPIRISGQLPDDKRKLLNVLNESLENLDEKRLRRRRERYMRLRR